MKQLSLLLSLYMAVILFSFRGAAQDGTSVSPSQGPPYVAYTSLYFYDGSGRIEYICQAKSAQDNFQWKRSDSTLTSIVVLTNTGTVTTSTANGLAVGNRVTVSGATVDTDLNGTYFIQAITSSTVFTITTASVANATYTESTLKVETTAPRSTAPVWDIKKYIYNGSGLVTNLQHANGASNAGKNASICDDRATSTGSTKIIYQ